MALGTAAKIEVAGMPNHIALVKLWTCVVAAAPPLFLGVNDQCVGFP